MRDLSAGLTDLLLGAVLVACALWLRSLRGVHRYWTAMFWTAGAGAWAGTAHHLLFQGSARASNLSWVAVGMLVAVALSYLLAASATELLAPRTARVFILLRVAGLLAYVVVITTLGVGRIRPLVLSESATMTAIVGLWLHALRRHHPRARRMLVAIAVSSLSAVAVILPGSVVSHARIDAKSLQHLAQIPGVLLFCRAIGSPPPGGPKDVARRTDARSGA